MSGELISFPDYQLTDIPNALRQLANKIETGDRSAVRCVIALEQEDGSVDYKAFGAEPFTRGHAIGLLFSAAHICAPEASE